MQAWIQGCHDKPGHDPPVVAWRNRTYNIGVATGLISGVWVFDVDGSNGASTLRDLEAKNGNLPATLISITSAGPHFWFRATGEIQSSAGRVGVGLDVRGDGGYVVAPPSVHPDGPVYRWGNDVPIATAPDWLIQLTRKRPTITERALATMRAPLQHCAAQPGAYGRAALEYEISALASTPNGQRNHALNRAAFSLFQLVAGGELNEAEVLNRLIEASFANGLMTDPERWASQCQAHHRQRPPCRNPAPAVPIMTSAPELWPFQHDIIAEFDRCVAAGDRRIMLVAPTGSGKTVIARRHHQQIRGGAKVRPGARA